MTSFSNDVDILKYEPVLFTELHLPWQVLTEGTGATLSGTTLTTSEADFATGQVTAGGVVYLRSADGTLDGPFEIVSVDSSTQLTISVIRTDSNNTAIAPPSATDISYRISTFGPQANEVGLQLTEYFDIRPGNPASTIDVADVLDTSMLRQASVFAVISVAYAMLAGKTNDENFWSRSLHYQRIFAEVRSRCRLSIDTNDDGIVDVTRGGSAGRLVRD